ncbi:asparagine synthetase B [Magnetospirillum sp. XM-1]|uniref:asparagine synthetase B family protein n=1 Tax=Magnetospirillum sp. XM-1 TaxID=1663591 RepID=UPI000838A355|nr:asparagine synthase-related protein [Magnetospirillum sp. XM-1]
MTVDEAKACLGNIRRGNDGIKVSQYGDVVLGSRRHLVKESHKAGVVAGESDQPYESADGRVRLVFNGEIFNFAELKKTMSAEGVGFDTDGDTEVWLRRYEAMGPAFVDDNLTYDSMFAVAVHDENRNQLLISRDWPGRVPLFYFHDRERRIFVFSSELKGMKPLGWMNLDLPVELVPGHRAILDLDTFELKIEQYYKPTPRKSTAELLNVGLELHRRLKRSAANRTMGDVPICTMLSGGIDSLMTSYYVFSSIDFERVSYKPVSYVFAIDNYVSEDVRRARIAAEGFKAIGLTLKEVRAPGAQVVEDLPDIIETFEMRKIKALSVYPLPIYYYLAPVMHQDGFKVTIGGHGVDELLGAYDAWKELKATHDVQVRVQSRLMFMNAIYENMMRRASIIFMNRGPIEARFPFLETQVAEYTLGIDPKWLGLTPKNAELMLELVNERVPAHGGWTDQLRDTCAYITRYLDNGGHPEDVSPETAYEMEKLFWKFPLIVAGMHAAAESWLPVHTLFNPKLRGQHGAGLTSLESMITERYRDLGSNDAEIFKSMVDRAFNLNPAA